MFSELVCEIGVCTDCMIADANGEVSPDRPADLPEVWSAIGFGYTVTMGGTHRETCENYPEWIGAECDCDNFGFTQSSCEGCGDLHHGDRFRFTLWRLTATEARIGHTVALDSARNPKLSRAERFAMIDRASQYRAYIGALIAERTSFARWMQSRKVAA